ncbi:hypothetical protein F2Q70_00043847 [Brassica cretica]|uniref:Uncharacterized protein n=1 Tax=Brassica cretica TaxID=69181 RepID=A0A8S9KD62_BRACR|nr:hypothetical protein F2Q70_00043847 [Brassica cretica]
MEMPSDPLVNHRDIVDLSRLLSENPSTDSLGIVSSPAWISVLIELMVEMCVKQVYSFLWPRDTSGGGCCEDTPWTDLSTGLGHPTVICMFGVVFDCFLCNLARSVFLVCRNSFYTDAFSRNGF